MIRLIARLDIKNDTVVKGLRMEGLRVVGKPRELADRYYRDGADELLYVDAVASLYGRNSLLDLVRDTARRIFIPMTVGGGLRTLDDIAAALRSGADKVALNTAAVARPQFIREAAESFGSQAVVISVQAKHRSNGRWEAFTESGREPSGHDVVDWVQEAIELGAGEVLLTSVDRDGTKAGFDLPLVRTVAGICRVPLMVCGGAGSAGHIVEVAGIAGVDAIVVGSILHYNRLDIPGIKRALAEAGVSVRQVAPFSAAVMGRG